VSAAGAFLTLSFVQKKLIFTIISGMTIFKTSLSSFLLGYLYQALLFSYIGSIPKLNTGVILMKNLSRFKYLLVGFLLTSGCSASSPSGVSSAPVLYQCNNGYGTISSHYREDISNDCKTKLLVKGQTYDFCQALSASGGRYLTETGLTPGNGLIWWIKGNGATLYAVPLSHPNPPATGHKVLAECTTVD